MNNIQKWLAALTEEEFGKLQSAMLKEQACRQQGTTVYPPEPDVLRAFEYFPPEETKVVIIGQDPYHGAGEAMGLSFSVPENVAVPPSLQNIYKELCREYGGTAPTTGDLTDWARQGVLLLNASLTVEHRHPNSHSDLWSGVANGFVRVCCELDQPIVFMLWGAFAQKLFDAAAPDTLVRKCVLTSTHPSPYSASTPSSTAVAFLGNNHFTKANTFLSAYGIEPIHWKD